MWYIPSVDDSEVLVTPISIPFRLDKAVKQRDLGNISALAFSVFGSSPCMLVTELRWSIICAKDQSAKPMAVFMSQSCQEKKDETPPLRRVSQLAFQGVDEIAANKDFILLGDVFSKAKSMQMKIVWGNDNLWSYLEKSFQSLYCTD
jgi:hypothetical protein